MFISAMSTAIVWNSDELKLKTPDQNP